MARSSLYPVIVCRSAAGYYIGQLDENGAPYSRLSTDYYYTREEAETYLTKGWFGGRWENQCNEYNLVKRGILNYDKSTALFTLSKEESNES